LILLSLLAFLFSFLFSLGGIGAAIVLVPIMYASGIPLNQAKATGLFYNTISLAGASYLNIKEKRLDFKIGLPLIIFSLIFAPVGAYLSSFVSHKIVLIIFILFLLFSTSVMWFFKSKNYQNNYREDRPFVILSIIGIVVGIVSGLLGVGGGGLISPIMIILGFNPKKVAAITAFVVPFSSFSGFLTYFAMGSVNFKILACVTISGFFGAFLGTSVMQKKFKPDTVKKLLGVILLILAIKMLLKLLN